jgi:TATA-box binding protein (TBP) (component of TFIID and TFIIIB)
MVDKYDTFLKIIECCDYNINSNIDKKIFQYIDFIKHKAIKNKIPEATPLRLSTRSAKCKYSCDTIEFMECFDNLYSICNKLKDNLNNNICAIKYKDIDNYTINNKILKNSSNSEAYFIIQNNNIKYDLTIDFENNVSPINEEIIEILINEIKSYKNLLFKKGTLINKLKFENNKININNNLIFDNVYCIFYKLQHFIKNTEILEIKYKDIITNKIIKKKPNNTSSDKDGFFNQATIIVKSVENFRQINIKIFINGSVTMTGCKYQNDGIFANNVIINKINKCKEIFIKQDINIFLDKYAITMINSDFFIGYTLDKIELCKIVNEKYDLFVTYEPLLFVAVKITYMWNKDFKDGICHCDKLCKNKKTEDNNCKKVTIMIYHTGKIVITGSNSEEQAYEVYHFIVDLLNTNYESIVRFSAKDYIKNIKQQKYNDNLITKFNIKVKKKIKIKVLHNH